MKEQDKNRRSTGVSSREELLRNSERRKKTPQKQTDERQPRKKTSDTRRSDDIRKSTPQSDRRKSTPDRTRPSTHKKKKKKKSWIRRYYRLIIVLVIFFLILLLLLSGVVRLFSGSKGKVRRAYAKTVNLYEKRDPILLDIMGKDAAKLIKKENVSQNFTLNLTDNTAGASGLSISGELNKNKSSKTADAQLTASYNDAAVAGLKMYTDNKKIMFTAPNIYNDWLEMDCENIVSQLADSALGANTEFSEDNDFSLQLFTDEKSEGEIVLSLSEEFSQLFTKEINSLSQKAEYKKIKEKKAVAIDGTEKNCRGYEIKINDEDFKNFLINMLSNVRRNKKIKNYLTQYAQLEYDSISALHLLFEDSDRLVENYYRQMDEALDRINKSTFTNTNATVYLYKGVICDLNFNTVYNIDEDKVNVNLRGGMYGGKKPYEDLDLTLELSDENKKLNFSYAETTDNIDSMLTHTTAFVIGNGSDDLVVTTKINFDKSTDIINGSANLTTPKGMYIDLSGSGNLKKSGGATTIDAQEIRLDYNGKLKLTMAGSYEIKPCNKRIEKPDGNITELFKADDAQLDLIEKTISDNMNSAVDNLNKALNFEIVIDEEETTTGNETTETTETTTAEEE